MGMQLNIKGDEAYRLASRLTELTGESLTAAVIEALRQRVEFEEQRRSAAQRDMDREAWLSEAMRLASLARDEFARGDAGPLTSNHDFLYDEDGLPF